MEHSSNTRKLRVFFYGTHLKHYYLAKWLIQKGHHCTLYLDEIKPRNMPEASDQSLVDNGYPPWIIQSYPRNGLLRRAFRLLSRSTLLPFKVIELLNHFEIKPCKEVLRIADQHDIIFTSGPENVLKSFEFSRPVVFRALGSDITQMPFASSNIQREFLGYYFRKNLKKLSKILIYQQDTYWAARLLKVSDKIRFYSVPTDLISMEDNVCAATYDAVRSKYSHYRSIFFLPARKNMDSTLSNYKGLDKALGAIQRIRDSGFEDFFCIATNHGWHFDEFLSEVKRLNLADKFCFIKPQPLTKLSAYMTQSNFLTINDIGYAKSHLTGIGRECVSLGGLMIDSVQANTSEFKSLYSSDVPPVYSAVTEQEVVDALEHYLSLNAAELIQRRDHLKSWAFNSLHWEHNINLLESILFESLDEGMPTL